MIAAKVRRGAVADQDRFRREDMLAMTPAERIMTLIRLRNSQFAAVSRPIRDSGIVSYRTLIGMLYPGALQYDPGCKNAGYLARYARFP